MFDQFESVWALLGYCLVVYYVFLFVQTEQDVKFVIKYLLIGVLILGLLGLIGLAISVIVYLISTVIELVVQYRYILISILIFVLVIIYLIEYLKWKKIKSEIDLLNINAATNRNNILNDYQRLESNKSIQQVFDNVIQHLPKDLLLDTRVCTGVERNNILGINISNEPLNYTFLCQL